MGEPGLVLSQPSQEMGELMSPGRNEKLGFEEGASTLSRDHFPLQLLWQLPGIPSAACGGGDAVALNDG